MRRTPARRAATIGAVTQGVLESLLICHSIEGVGVPLATATNWAGLGAWTVASIGWVVTIGATWTLTIKVAALLIALPEALANTARKRLPLSAMVVAGVV